MLASYERWGTLSQGRSPICHKAETNNIQTYIYTYELFRVAS